MTICLLCGNEIGPKEYPIPIAVLKFQPVTRPGNFSTSMITAQYACQSCFKAVKANEAKIAADAGKTMIEAGNAH